MVRTLLAALLLFVSMPLLAQQPDIKPVDTPEMIANAEKYTAMVDRAVRLNKDQKVKVQEIYLQQERQIKALQHRMQGQPQADVEADMRGQYQVMDETVQRELSNVLTPDQMSRWMEDSK